MMINMTGEEWRVNRSIVTPIFTSGRLKGVVPTIHKSGKSLIKHMEALVGEAANSKDLFATYAFEIIMNVGFGIEVNSWKDKDNVVKKMAYRSLGLDGNGLKFMVSFLVFLVSPSLHKSLGMSFMDLEATEFMANIMRQTIKQRKDEAAKGQSKRFVTKYVSAIDSN